MASNDPAIRVSGDKLKALRLVAPGTEGLDQEEHPTGNLPVYPALDIHGVPGAAVTAPENLVVTRLSGSDPSRGIGDSRVKSFGYSIYARGEETGTEYLFYHLGDQIVPRGSHQRAGNIIGHIGDFPDYAAPDHLHFGTHLPRHPGSVLDVLYHGGTLDGKTVPPRTSSTGGSASDAGSYDIGDAAGDVKDAAKAVTGWAQAIARFFNFLLSLRFLEILGGGILLVLALRRLLERVGVHVPLPAVAARAAAA